MRGSPLALVAEKGFAVWSAFPAVVSGRVGAAAGYIEVEKTFKGKKPCTICRITPVGLKAFEDYVNTLKSYLEVHP